MKTKLDEAIDVLETGIQDNFNIVALSKAEAKTLLDWVKAQRTKNVGRAKARAKAMKGAEYK